MLHTRRPPCIPTHALHDNDLDMIKADAESWEFKDGFPCTHRCSKQYLLDPKLVFTKLYQRYKDKIKSANDGHCVVLYSRWIQYIHLFFPGLHLVRIVEDICNCCVRIDIQLQRDDLPSDEHNCVLLKKQTHMDAAISQCRIMSTFVKEFIKQHTPDQHVPYTIIPDSYDDDRVHDDVNIYMTSTIVVPTIQIQIEDFGGSFAMLHYGNSRPLADYFNSNLMVSNFVVVD